MPSIVANISRSARAWTGISSEGGQRVSSLGSSLLTLSAHRTGLLPRPAPGALGALVEQATADLEWMVSSVARLTRIHSGIKIALEQLDTLDSNDNDVLLTHSLSVAEWHSMIENVGEVMRSDLDDKRKVLDELQGAATGTRGIHAENIEVLAALWLEAPTMHARIVELPAAVLEAEKETARLSVLLVHEKKDAMKAQPATPSSHKKESLSPAMAMLLGE